MVKPVCKTEAQLLHPFLVRARHIYFDTTVESQNPPVLYTTTSYHIQWQNIAESISKWKLHWDLANLAYNPRMAMRGSVAFVGKTETAVNEGGAHATIANFTFSHDATGSDIIVVGATGDNNAQTFTATYNSLSLTEAKRQTGNRSTWIGYRASPTTGSNTVQVNYTAANDAGFGVAVTFSGSSGTMNGGVGATGNSTGTGNLNVTSATDDMVFDIVAVGAGKTAPVAGGGQTQRLNGDDSYWHDALASTEAGAATTTMSWTWSSGSFNFCHAAANIVQASAAPSFTPRVSFIM